MREQAVRLLTNLLGIYSPSGKEEPISDFLVDAAWGVISYPIISTGTELLPLPMSILNWEPSKQIYQLTRAAGLLEGAPSFQSGQYPDTSQSNWDENILNYWLNAPAGP